MSVFKHLAQSVCGVAVAMVWHLSLELEEIKLKKVKLKIVKDWNGCIFVVSKPSQLGKFNVEIRSLNSGGLPKKDDFKESLNCLLD